MHVWFRLKNVLVYGVSGSIKLMETPKLTKYVWRNTCHGQIILPVRPMVLGFVMLGNVSQNIFRSRSFMAIGRAGQGGQRVRFHVDEVSESANDFVIVQLHKMEENSVLDQTQVMNCAIQIHAISSKILDKNNATLWAYLLGNVLEQIFSQLMLPVMAIKSRTSIKQDLQCKIRSRLDE